MARQAAIKTLTVDALIELRQSVLNELALRSADLKKQLHVIASYTGGGIKSSGKLNPLMGKKVAPKYRDPKTGDTYSGRGQMASWLAAKIKAGAKLEDFLIAKPAAAAKAKAGGRKVSKRKPGHRKAK
jgi:DNA-binding protein H-NS